MRIKQQVNRITAWLVFCTILFSAMAPVLSQTLSGPHAGADQWVQICSAAGDRLVQLDLDTGAPSPDGNTFHGQHCPLCVSHTVADGLPAALHVLMLLLPDTASNRPAFHAQAPQAPHLWPASLARAPPAPF